MEQKVNEIIAHVHSQGGKYPEWYCGIASDAKDRLFNGHNVSEKYGHWIFRNFGSSEVARSVEKYFIESLGFDGGSGGGSLSTVFVYAYRKTIDTVE